MTVVVTHTTPADGTFSAAGAAAWDADHALSGLGTMAEQNKTSVDIEGGTIDNTTIGATTPSTGVFTTLTATGQTSLGGVAGAESIRVLTPVAAAGLRLQVGVPGSSVVRLGPAGASVADFRILAPTFTNFYTGSSSDGLTDGALQARVAHTASAVNYVQVTGGATTKGVIQSAQGSDSNISYVTQSKGTGAIDLAAGSSGVNISNGGTVTALTFTASGNAYTSFPSIAITAPTTAGGVQATATLNRLFQNIATVAGGGTGYTVGDTLTVVGGTPAGSAATLTVSSVSGGVITAVASANFAQYTALPTNPVSVTGGTGSGATLNLQWSVLTGTGSYTITNAGSGYVEQPTVTFSGGGGSGAAAYATVGSGTTLKSLGSTLSLSTAGGEQVRVLNTNSVNYLTLSGSGSGSAVAIGAAGTDGGIATQILSKGSGTVEFWTNGGNQRQAVVAHTASAVNYVQVTGAATGGRPAITAQGSDANIDFGIAAKGVYSVFLSNASGISLQTYATGSANYLRTTGVATGFGPTLTAQGSDTNIPLVLQPKGTGALQAQQTDSTATGGNARGANAVDWQTIRSGASQVAAGQYGVISGGISNTVNSVGGVVGGGSGNFVSSSGYVGGVFSGQSNQSNGFYSPVVGGASNQANGYYNFIGAGFTNTGTASAAVTTQSATMNGTTAVTLSGSNASIKVGQIISGTSIAGDTYVAAISGTSLTLSKVASGSSTSTLSFYTPHGVVVGGGNNQATGSYSFIGGGGDAGTAANRNVASGDWSVVGGGLKGVASGQNAFVGGGSGAIASGTYAVVSGGVNNQATGFGSTSIGGYNNISNSAYSATLGGNFASTRGIEGISVFGSQTPLGGTLALAQSSLLVLAVQTTDATATVLRSNASAASTTNQVILPNNSAYYFKVEIIANVTGGGNTSGWELKGVIKRGANAASTAIVGSVTSTLIAQDAGASTWVVSATADTTNGGLKITVTGQASTTIRWVAKASTTEVTF